MDNINLNNTKYVFISTKEYFKSLLKYINQNKILMPLGSKYNLTEHIKLGNEINHEFKDSLEKFSSITKEEYIIWDLRKEVKIGNDYFLKANRIIGKIENDLKDIYEFKENVGHIIPIKPLGKYKALLKYTNEISCKKCTHINNNYNKFKNLNGFKDLQNNDINTFYIQIPFLAKKFIKFNDSELSIDLSSLRSKNNCYLKTVKEFCEGDFLLGEFIYEEEETKVLRTICKIKKLCFEKNLKMSLEVISKEEKPYEITYLTDIKNGHSGKNDINYIKTLINKERNIILYGPPGTGKTYNLDNEILKIIDYCDYSKNIENRELIHNKVKELQNNNQVRFCTFHQSYGYEEFIEGLRSDGKGNFALEDGILKEIAFEALFEGLLYYLKADLLEKIPSMDENTAKLEKKKLVLNYISDSNNFCFFNTKQYVIVIDEINRGNISKIFGELITLLEEDKRLTAENEVLLKLPYSKEQFILPPNLHLIGTMNSSDKSIAPIDIALRRRFKFKEIMPNENLLKVIENIDLCKMLYEINSRIEYLYDRNYMIGHAYFINCSSKEDIINTIKDKIIPLLQEYFYEDWYKIGLVLGGIGSSESDNYIIFKEEINPKNLFNEEYLDEFSTSYRYKIKSNISEKELKSIYE